MKPRMLRITLSGLLLTILVDGSMAAPAPAGRPTEIASFQAHRFDVQGLAFSPDGKTLASGGRDGKLKLWDVASLKNIADIHAYHPNARLGRTGMVDSVAFSPDGKTVASCGDDRKIKLWGVATDNNLGTLDGSLGPPLVFSPDGKTLVCGYRRFDLETKKDQPLVEKITGAPLAAAFDPKGKLLVATASGWPEPPCVWLWDVTTGKKAVTCKGHDKYLMGMAFSRDGKMMASASYDQTVRLWDVSTGKNTAIFDKLPRWSSCLLSFSPDGKVLAMDHKGERDSIRVPGSILLLDVPSGKVLATLKGHKGVVTCVAFSADGRLLASGCIDGTIKIWSLPARYETDK